MSQSEVSAALARAKCHTTWAGTLLGKAFSWAPWLHVEFLPQAPILLDLCGVKNRSKLKIFLISYLHISLSWVHTIEMVWKDHLNFKYGMKTNDCIRQTEKKIVLYKERDFSSEDCNTLRNRAIFLLITTSSRKKWEILPQWRRADNHEEKK